MDDMRLDPGSAVQRFTLHSVRGTQRMPLPNRVTPFGDLIAVASRGLFMGNRGGRFHRDDRTLGARRWASRQWICCVTEFKQRHRAVWGNRYTELFFLDEPTAFAAGHRPCFECRRRDAVAFAANWAASLEEPAPPAAEMDRANGAAKWMTARPRLSVGMVVPPILMSSIPSAPVSITIECSAPPILTTSSAKLGTIVC